MICAFTRRQAAVEKLDVMTTELLERLIAYFDLTWMTMYGPNRFSVYGACRRTNNALESANNKLNRLVGSNHPNIFALIGRFSVFAYPSYSYYFLLLI